MLEAHKQQSISIRSARLIVFTVLGIFILVAGTIGSAEINEDTRQNQELAKIRKERDALRARNNTLRSERDNARHTTGQWKDEACQLMARYLKTLQELEEEKALSVKATRETLEKQKAIHKLQQEMITDAKKGTETSRGGERDDLNGADSGRTYLGEFRATGYCPCAKCNEGYSGTATGSSVHYGIVATDPRRIPLGTKLYIEGYGEAIAADTGGDIKNKRLDCAFNSHQEALKWGIRTVKVYRR